MPKAKRYYSPDGKKLPEYSPWQQMIGRCYCSSASGYAKYGGSGVTVCDRWRGPDGFWSFLADMGQRPSPQHSIDRFPNGGGNYEPGNCRWATPTEQQRNKKANRVLNHAGESRCVTEWAEVLGIPATTLFMRLRLGWDDVRTLTTPVHPKRSLQHITHNGRTLTISEWSTTTGLKRATIYNRLFVKKWPVGRTLDTPTQSNKCPKRYR